MKNPIKDLQDRQTDESADYTYYTAVKESIFIYRLRVEVVENSRINYSDPGLLNAINFQERKGAIQNISMTMLEN